MRKNQQKQLLTLVSALKEAHVEIKRLLTQKDTPSMARILANCRNGAIQMYEFITQLEGEATKTAAYVNEYRELLDHLSANTRDYGNNAGFSKQFANLLFKVKTGIMNELKPYKIEMLFLPYKASMWDSMESVWFAANEDLQCDAYVVPIPYYVRNSDHSLGEMFYEGDQYPNYVPIVDWRQYNIEERHPDIIVIHNPYDDANYVTSVHPEYYSKRLKNLTDLLCYIPYFVTNGTGVEEHFCTTHGPFFAHKTFVQTETVRQVYIRCFRELEKKNNAIGALGSLDEKFIASGSPKFDAVINKTRDDFKLPDEWIKLVDGKKVILYNTTLDAILRGDRQYLTKLCLVIDRFNKRSDVVLWWRPHPLSEATYRSMRPALFEKYEQIIKKYKHGGFGIYDDTADLHRAIAWSDAYYGDYSSLVPMYQCTGKPAMLQSVLQPDPDSFEFFFCIYNCGNYRLLIDVRTDSLFIMNWDSGQATYVRRFSNTINPFGKMVSYNSCIRVEDRLYFIPSKADNVLYCDLVDGKLSGDDFKNIPLMLTNECSEKFIGAGVYKNHLFIFPDEYPAVVKIALDTHHVDYLHGITENVTPDVSGKHFCHQFYVLENRVYLASVNSDAVVCFYMDTCSVRCYTVDGNKCGFDGICFDGTSFWLLSRDEGSPVLKWNPSSGVLSKITYSPNGFTGGGHPFDCIFHECGTIFLIPRTANRALKINVENGKMTLFDEFQKECEIHSDNQVCLNGFNYRGCRKTDGKIFAFAVKSRKLVEFDAKTYVAHEMSVLLSESDTALVKRYRNSILTDFQYVCIPCYCHIFCENESLPLDLFLNYVSVLKEDECLMRLKNWLELYGGASFIPVNVDGTSGKTIYANCRNEVLK